MSGFVWTKIIKKGEIEESAERVALSLLDRENRSNLKVRVAWLCLNLNWLSKNIEESVELVALRLVDRAI